MVWRRMKVTRKTGGRGGVSYTITIPEEIYQAMGRPEEVLVTYRDGAMLVRPARSIYKAKAGAAGDARIREMLSLIRSNRIRSPLMLNTLREELERENPPILVVDCGRGAIAYKTEHGVEAAGFDPGLCSDLATILAGLLTVDPEELDRILRVKTPLIIEVAPNKVVVYRV